MKEIDTYKIAWNAKAHEGILLLHTTDGGLEQILMDNPAEAALMLDIIKNEKPVFYENGLLFTGFEAVGEGE